MGRNKLIHRFGNYTIVVRSGHESGGTWEGAMENISNDWSTLSVCNYHNNAPGNKKLISKGGIPIDPEQVLAEDSFGAWVEKYQ